LYSNGTMTDLGSLGGADKGSSGDAINVSGEVAGLSQTMTAGVTHATLWTGTVMVDLGALAPLSSGSWSGAFGINDSGQVVGAWRDTVSHPWLYSNGTMASLPEPSYATAQGATGCSAIFNPLTAGFAGLINALVGGLGT
jgi:probable HAF family extracellular repeat protein